VLAARLTEDPAVKVLLLEAGSQSHNPLLAMPLGEMMWVGNPRYDWRFQTIADPTADDRCLQIPRGRLVGGSNGINGMLFVRGQREDYDDWAELGCPGWSWDEVLPYFQRVERVRGAAAENRGRCGLITIAPPRERDRLSEAFLASAVTAGYKLNSDYNSGTQDGFGYYQVMHDRGRRSSATGSYLKGARRRTNLTLLTGAYVTSIRLEGTRCVGVGYRRGSRHEDVSCDGEVLVCAGVIQSPQLLELSGIGSSRVLERLGRPVVHDLPGVGENLRDHFAVRLKWRAKGLPTFNERTRGLRLFREMWSYALARRGALSLPVALGFGFVSSSPSESRPDIQFHFSPASYDSETRRFEAAPAMTLGIYPLRPESSGSVHIRSGDPLAPPIISSRFLDCERDRSLLISGIRIGRSIVAQEPLDAYRTIELSPGRDVDTDAELTAYIRATGDTSYHPVGTCRMGSDPMAVVDHRLSVRGLRGLRVVDASVMPTLVSGNTNAATFMIAEKGAAMVREDRG
jgi:choline dehydrogenase